MWMTRDAYLDQYNYTKLSGESFYFYPSWILFQLTVATPGAAIEVLKSRNIEPWYPKVTDATIKEFMAKILKSDPECTEFIRRNKDYANYAVDKSSCNDHISGEEGIRSIKFYAINGPDLQLKCPNIKITIPVQLVQLHS
ncbi:hypothetical protein VNO77_34149 [Canavalia gladiata]|uniref:Uncharacterized protein n=1 Tax=Canavalia gladiata TaxID=3824 RepID=A0AAN9KG87_CANGL